MTSKGVLAIHTTVFALFVIAALSSPLLAIYHPALFSPQNLFALGILALLVIGSWPLFGGCPFTVWEKNLREREAQGSAYTKPCMDYYAYVWFGLHLPPHLNDVILIALLLLPVASGLLFT